MEQVQGRVGLDIADAGFEIFRPGRDDRWHDIEPTALLEPRQPRYHPGSARVSRL